MKLKSCLVSDWRGLGLIQLDFAAGLNLLQGPNECGKSRVVEALEWALFRRTFEASAEEVVALQSTNELSLSPSVELDFDLADGSGTIVKQLHEKLELRSCHLTLRGADGHDHRWEGGEAEGQFHLALARDAVDDEASSTGTVPDAELLFSHQARPARYLRAGAGVLGSVLDLLRPHSLRTPVEQEAQTVEMQLRAEVTFPFLDTAVGAARASTPAALARDALNQARGRREIVTAGHLAIVRLREEQAALKKQKDELVPRDGAARAGTARLTQLRGQQVASDAALREAKARAREAAAVQMAARQEDANWAALEESQSVAGPQLAAADLELEVATSGLAEARSASAAAAAQSARCADEFEGAVREAAAWRSYLRVHETRADLRREEKLVEQNDILRQQLVRANAALADTAEAPDPDEFHRWEALLTAWLNVRADLAMGLTLSLRPQKSGPLQVSRDGEPPRPTEIRSETDYDISAATEIVIDAPGWGQLKVGVGPATAAEQARRLQEARAALALPLTHWELTPEVFETSLSLWRQRVQQRQIAVLAAEQARWRLEEAGTGSRTPKGDSPTLAELRTRWEEARSAAKGFTKDVPLGRQSRAEVAEMVTLAERQVREAASRATQARNEVSKRSLDLRRAQEVFDRAAQQPTALRAAMAARDEQLRSSAPTSSRERREALAALESALLKARQEELGAQQRRGVLGPGVSTWQVEEAASQAQQLATQLYEVERNLAEVERDLDHHDREALPSPEEMAAEVDRLRAEVEAHEKRLQSLAARHEALQSQLPRGSAAGWPPVEEEVTRVLSAMRGKTTSLVMDDLKMRLMAVRESDGSELPLASLSHGLREQVALALRLVLASRAAAQRPSGRLPLVLDDPLTQTDADRREALLAVLAGHSSQLQIIVATCHDLSFAEGIAVHQVAMGAQPPATTFDRGVGSG